MFTLKSMSSHQQHMLDQERLVFEFSIVGNATPASKKQAVDIDGLVVLRTEGQTAAADAIEALTWTAPVDDNSGDSIFGVLLYLDLDIADKVYTVTVTEPTGISSALSVTGPNAAPGAYLTANGNIAIEIAATDLDLSADSPTFLVKVDYREVQT